MGQGPSKLAVDQLRADILSSCKGQKFLLIGGDGHGKSSLINSMNHVLRLQDPQAKFQEIAGMGAGRGKTKTASFRNYDEDLKLFTGVEREKGTKMPHFQDLCGMSENETSNCLKLIPLLAAGQIKDGTDMREYMDGDFDLSSIAQPTDKQLRCWSIIFVASAYHDFPVKLATHLREAADRYEVGGQGVQIFCILTFIDKCSAAQLREAVRNTEETLNISTIRIFQISNYTSAELGRDLTTLPNLRKEEALLQAFHTMVQEAYTPYFQSSGKK